MSEEIKEDVFNSIKDDETIKSLKISQRFWKLLHERNLPHHHIFECPTSSKEKDDNYAVKFEKNIFQHARDIKESFNCTPYDIDYPIPLISPVQELNDIDPCFRLITEKEQYREDLNEYKMFHKSNKKKSKYVSKQKYRRVPQYFLKVAKSITKDPDEFFKGYYDWYYTGGVTDHVRVGNDYFILNSHTENNINVIDLERPEIAFKLNTFCNSKSPIYNIKSYECSSGFVTLTRKKHDLELIYCKIEDSQLSYDLIWSYNSAVFPLIDFKMNQLKYEIFSTDVSHNIRHVDLEKGITLGEYNMCEKAEELPDQLAQVEVLDNNTVLFMDRKSLKNFDLNSGNVQKYVFDTDYFNCNEFCCLLHSKRDRNYVFVATRHNILQIDLRKMQNCKFSNKWSHLMVSPPTVMSSVLDDLNTECLYLCGPIFNDKIVLSVSERTDLPKLVPNALDLLQMVNLSGNKFFSEHVETRVKLCNAGNTVVRHQTGTQLITSNSIGDIFVQDLFKNNCEEKVQKFVKWINKIPKKDETLEVSALSNLSHTFFDMKKETDETYLEKLRKENKYFDILENDFHEMDLSETAVKVLDDLWEDEDLMEPKYRDIVGAGAVTPTHKVTEWLLKTDDNDKKLNDLSYLNNL